MAIADRLARQLAALPDLSRDAASAAPNDQLRARIAVGFRRIAFFVVPSAFAFAALGPAIVGALFQTGRFDADDTALVGSVLAAYGVGLLGQATVKLFASGFYALRDTRTPVKIAALSLAVSAGLSWVLMRSLGPAGIALGSSLGSTLNVVLHLRDLDRRIGTVLGPGEWRVFGAAVFAIPHGLAVLGIFGVTYGVLTLALRHPDALRSWQSLTGSRAS